MLTDRQKTYFRDMLTHRLNELLTEGNRTLSGMSDQGDRLPDPSDRATMESETSFTLRIRDRERHLIGKIKDALTRIENGTYGVCEECEEEISEARLKARPVTTLCIACKSIQERTERPAKIRLTP
jgi:DnaK suppressor protein